ncbi:YihY/virulence factor BrkB family protein [Methylobacterium sp. E-041]|jgi:membrane protein|uniref:YihY/virulence factor BrkB family protein n=2 Tax=Methylobacterium TaxID=407 RepID=UPI0011CC3EBE|nr:MULTISPECIES: YihY/virulence factor BrkB family protein [unclassified Methylobacterium]MCJ2042255.1 YihY/virulence factor BrkB family protein [Methylobacterium sp. J-059]MCJ2075968.1 YihY/virulence factor BrkB family protein [Methylobacterium sp. E-016]MCJ2106395.1 YihY/virulence factor BrkB family protein [Methylobacterium sp. E-041]MCJ2113757.1 YihY/virulence factor BrkB family protein [Methylobacterium sp. E-025]TXN34173.1 YihY/virulence factor BrkB family protein [Methylobacterium sp. W
MKPLRTALEVAGIAAQRFVSHDGWAIASHIALSILTSLFPFLILLAALAGLLGTKSLADEAGLLIFDAWPREVAKPIVGEVHRVLTEQRGGVLTVGALLALYFSSSGVESLRVGLNRAYGLREMRPWWLTRLESIGYVVCGACAMLAFALLVVLGPLIWRNVVLVAPGLEPLGLTVAIARIGITALLLAAVLIIAHKFVAAGRRSFLAVLPGIGVTLLLWFFAGLGFGFYLDRFSNAYASTYGGLATAMVFLVFLYWLAAMFLFGGEINGTVIAAKRSRLRARMHARQARPPVA